MIKTIIYGVFIVLAVLAVVVFHVPGFWILLAVILLLLVKTLYPFKLSVETIPREFTEKKFNTGEVILNYVEGPDN